MRDIIADDMYLYGQSWHKKQVLRYTSLTKGEVHTIELHICRNAYDDQSFGRVRRFDGTRWEVLIDLPGVSLLPFETRRVSYVWDENKVKDGMTKGVDALLSRARALLD